MSGSSSRRKSVSRARISRSPSGSSISTPMTILSYSSGPPRPSQKSARPSSRALSGREGSNSSLSACIRLLLPTLFSPTTTTFPSRATSSFEKFRKFSIKIRDKCMQGKRCAAPIDASCPPDEVAPIGNSLPTPPSPRKEGTASFAHENRLKNAQTPPNLRCRHFCWHKPFEPFAPSRQIGHRKTSHRSSRWGAGRLQGTGNPASHPPARDLYLLRD